MIIAAYLVKLYFITIEYTDAIAIAVVKSSLWEHKYENLRLFGLCCPNEYQLMGIVYERFGVHTRLLQTKPSAEENVCEYLPFIT